MFTKSWKYFVRLDFSETNRNVTVIWQNVVLQIVNVVVNSLQLPTAAVFREFNDDF